MSTPQSETHGTVTGLQVIAIYVSDRERARAFYEGLLGFAKTGEMPPGLLLSGGGVTLYVEPGRTSRTENPATTCGIAPAFAAESVLAVHEKLLAAGVPMLGELQRHGEDFAFFQCLDPDGNVIEFAGTP